MIGFLVILLVLALFGLLAFMLFSKGRIES